MKGTCGAPEGSSHGGPLGTGPKEGVELKPITFCQNGIQKGVGPWGRAT